MRVDETALADGGEALSSLAEAFASRRAVVIELAIEPQALRAARQLDAEPWTLEPELVLAGDRLHHLVWANAYDARSEGEPVWWWAEKALRLDVGAQRPRDGVADGEPCDIVLADGRPALVDGGPRWSVPEPGLAVVHRESVEAGRLPTVPKRATPGADLAADQLRAVSHEGGAVRVIAPAGSGKTRVLTERLRHLLADRGYEREGVLAVAYNKQAQLELEGRLAELSPRTRTLNSLGYALVSAHAGSRPSVLSELEVRSLVEEAFPIPRRRAHADPVTPFVEALAEVRLGLRDPAEVEAERDDVAGLAEGFAGYRASLLERRVLDFDEQIYRAIELLLADGAFRREAQRSHRHLLVDEFQDLTPAHVLLVRLLAMPELDVFAVGDDDQTIYDHAGADPRFLVHFERLFPGAGATALEVNYRCPEAIVGAATNLLSRNAVRVAKRIRAVEGARGDPDALEVCLHATSDGAAELVGRARRWLDVDGAAPGEVAVLARVNSLLMAPQVALGAAGVPVRPALTTEILERAGIAATLAWMRVALAPDDIVPRDLELIARRPSRGLPRWVGGWLRRCRSLGDLRRAARRIEDARVATRLGELADDVELVAAGSLGATSRELIERVRDDAGLGGAMQALDGSKGSQSAASHLDDIEALAQVADLEPDPGEFEPWLRRSLAREGEPDGVTLSTVHRVKGREWERVLVFGAAEGLVPHRLAEDREAERRVLHVAITRARVSCCVLGDRERPSPFVAELAEPGPELAARPPDAERTSPRRATQGDAGTPGGAGRAGRGPGSGARARPPSASAPPNGDVERALRDWRRERAQADGVPAYVVLNDRQLVGIARAEPADERELTACEGIGPARLERYGEEILATIAAARD